MEDWRDVFGYNGIYQVSNKGNVRSLTHYCEGRKGSGKQTGRVLKQRKSHKGYLRVSLSLNKKRFNTGTHRLVALAFIDNPLNKPQVNHINGIKDDNRVENLEWCTNRENQLHAIKNKLVKYNYGQKHHNSKLTDKEVLNVRRLNEIGFTNKELSEDYNISKTAMSNILRKITYKNVK